MENNNYQKVAPFILFVLALILLFLLVRPMISILLGGVLLSYLSYPLYKKINMKIPNKTFSIILALFAIAIVVSIPFSFLAIEIIQEGGSFYDSVSNDVVFTKGALFGLRCDGAESRVCSLLNYAEKFGVGKLSKFSFDKKIQNFAALFEEKITDFILSIPLLVAKIFLVLVSAFFITKDWKKILMKMTNLLPMRRRAMDKLVKQFEEITYTVVYAQLFVALIQGIIATMAFYVFGIPFPIILGILTAFCALIPTIGTAIIWAPVSIIFMIIGYASNDYGILMRGVGLFFCGLFVISTIDNLLLATIVKTKTKVNQLVVIVGVIGGGFLFGIVGIFVGPILLPLLITYFETFKERFA